MKEEMKKLREVQNQQSQTISELNTQIEEERNNKNNKNEENNQNNDINEPSSKINKEIQALWKSQDEKYTELKQEMQEVKQEMNEQMETKLEATKSNILEVIETNKDNLTKELVTLREAQEESQAQQATATDKILSAIDKLNERMNSKHPNPPISPVKQGSWHGGSK